MTGPILRVVAFNPHCRRLRTVARSAPSLVQKVARLQAESPAAAAVLERLVDRVLQLRTGYSDVDA